MSAIGRMRERVTIQQNTTTTDSQGGRSSSWGTLATVWAELVPMNGREALEAQQVTSLVPWRFRAYYRSDVTPKMRVSWTPSWASGATAKTLEILAVRPGPTWMELECGERG